MIGNKKNESGLLVIGWVNSLFTTDKMRFHLLSIYLTLIIQKQIPLKWFQDREAKKECF